MRNEACLLRILQGGGVHLKGEILRLDKVKEGVELGQIDDRVV